MLNTHQSASLRVLTDPETPRNNAVWANDVRMENHHQWHAACILSHVWHCTHSNRGHMSLDIFSSSAPTQDGRLEWTRCGLLQDSVLWYPKTTSAPLLIVGGYAQPFLDLQHVSKRRNSRPKIPDSASGEILNVKLALRCLRCVWTGGDDGKQVTRIKNVHVGALFLKSSEAFRGSRTHPPRSHTRSYR